MHLRSWWSRATAAGLAATLGAGVLAGCSSGDAESGKSDKKLTVWSLENLPPRIAATKKIITRFERDTGVQVELVGVDEGQLPQLIMSAAAAGNLPDVIGSVPMGQVWQMYGNGLLNTKATTDIVKKLGPKTFSKNALGFTSDGARQLSVPSDAWLQLLVYRKDRLKKADLPAPDTYQGVLDAAEALNTPGHDGISLASDPADVFTQQSFESVALANDCRLVDNRNRVDLASPACRKAFATYDTLARKYGAPGTQTVDTTRAAYFAGKSSMIVWSSFVLDELAALRKDALPSCPQCKKDPEFLASNSGIVTAMKGSGSAKPSQFGEITSWAVTKTAQTGPAKTFVDYMLTKGYEDWFGMAPEGKIPVRTGTADDPDRFRRAWRSSDMGVESRKPMDEVYPGELLDQLTEGVGSMKRWGITEGQGALVGATNGELPVPKTLGAMTSGQITPAEAARDAADEVTALQKSLR